MSKKCMSCGELNELHTSNHPAACIGILKAKVDDILSAISRGDYSYVESVYLDYDDDGNPPVAALKQEGRLERSLSRSTAFPASQAALKGEGEL